MKRLKLYEEFIHNQKKDDGLDREVLDTDASEIDFDKEEKEPIYKKVHSTEVKPIVLPSGVWRIPGWNMY